VNSSQQKYLELLLDELLQRDKGYLDLKRQMDSAPKRLTGQRVGRAHKRDSIKASEQNIRKRQQQIEEHNRQEVLCLANFQSIEQALQARREGKRRYLMPDKRLPV
jgi:hypothetical protein